MNRRTRASRTAAMCALALACMGSAGCGSSQSQRSDDLPSLRDIRRRDRIPEEVAQTFEQATASTPLRVERIDLSLDGDAGRAWNLLETRSLSPGVSGAWRGNGIRVGVLKGPLAGEFVKRLPEVSGHKGQVFVPGSLPSMLLGSPPLNMAVAVDLTVPPRPVREAVLAGGRIQMLVEVVRDAMDRPVLVLTPHHHVPQRTLTVRTAEEKQLDGRMLNELSLAVRLEGGEALVIGLDVPPLLFSPMPDPAAPPTGIQQAQPRLSADPVEPVAPVEPVTPRTPQTPDGTAEEPPPPVADRIGPHLGRALFTATRYGRPIQMIYIIRFAS